MSILFSFSVLILFILQYVENKAEHHKNVDGACDSELLTEIRKMQKKMDLMEETISKLTKSKTRDCPKYDNGTYLPKFPHMT